MRGQQGWKDMAGLPYHPSHRGSRHVDQHNHLRGQRTAFEDNLSMYFK